MNIQGSFEVLVKRRILETVSQVMNWAFALLILAWILVAATYVFSVVDPFYELLAGIVNVLVWLQGIMFLLVLVLSFAVWATDYSFPVGLLIWSLVRTLLASLVLIVTYSLDRIAEKGIAFSL